MPKIAPVSSDNKTYVNIFRNHAKKDIMTIEQPNYHGTPFPIIALSVPS